MRSTCTSTQAEPGANRARPTGTAAPGGSLRPALHPPALLSGRRGIDTPSEADRRQALSQLRARIQPPAPPPQAQDLPLLCGIPAIDHFTPTGLPRGEITEWIAPAPSSGAQIALLCLAGRARALGWRTGLVDPADGFDPDSCPPALLPHLVWVRPASWPAALLCADSLALDGNLPLVVLDARSLPATETRRLPAASWHRLRHSAAHGRCHLLVLSDLQICPSAALRIRLDGRLHLPDLDAPPRAVAQRLAATALRSRFSSSTPEALAA